MPEYWIWFAELKGISPVQKRQLLDTFGDPEELYRAHEKTLKTLPASIVEALGNKDLSVARQILQSCARKSIRVLTYQDADYPEKLRNIEDLPFVLYCAGTLPEWDAQPVIGIVGTRKASPYGLHTARLLAAQIAACGGLVVSGAAAGVDGCAMEGALDADRPTVGVLGGGVDVVYPASNRTLYNRTREKGCLISEYPPGTRPFPGHFLQRNRIISGLSDGVLVVEAPQKSGALNTARHAYSQGRDLFAVPGNLGVDSCLGSNALLQEGAYAVLNGWDVVKHYAPLYPDTVENCPAPILGPAWNAPAKVAQRAAVPEKVEGKKEAAPKNAIDNWKESTYSGVNKRPTGLSEGETAVYELLSPDPELIDSILDRTDLPAGAVQTALTRLTLKGLAVQYPDGRISKK